MRIRRWATVAAALALASAPFTTALAKEIVSVTLSGPGLAGVVQVTDASQFETLLEILGSGVPTGSLPDLGPDFYEMRVAFGDEAGEVFATNVYHYYPDPEGGRGYVLYAAVEGGSASDTGRWFRAVAPADQALRAVLAAHGVNLGAQPASQPVPLPAEGTLATTPQPAAASPWTAVALAALGTLLISGVGAFLLRSNPRTSSTIR